MLFLSDAYNQKISKKNLIIYYSAGVHNNDADHYKFGWYFKTGIEKQVCKKVNAGIQYLRTKINNYPKKFHVYSFQQPDEQAIIDYWVNKHIIKADWVSGRKGFFDRNTADIFSFYLSYIFNISKKVFIVPKLGISKICSSRFRTGLFDAYFDPTATYVIGGKVGYDIRNTRRWGINYGINLTYSISRSISVFLDIQWEDDEGEAFNYFNGRQGGFGIAYNFTPSSKLSAANRK